MWTLPRSLREKVLWVYQGGDIRELARQAQERKIVGIGGIVRMLEEQDAERVLTYLITLGEVLQEAGAQAHIIGLGSPYLLNVLRGTPWFGSFDTSKWLLAYKAHAVLLENGECCGMRQLGLRLRNRECASNNIRVLKGWADPKDDTLLMLLVVSAKSGQVLG